MSKPKNSRPEAVAFLAFLDALRRNGHAFPGTETDAAAFIRDALDVLDPDWAPELDDVGLQTYLAASFGMIVNQLEDMGIAESERPEE